MVDRVYQRNASDSAPQPPADPSTGYPTNGNPAEGVPATQPGEWWYHMITESLRKVIADAGLTPDHTDVGQLMQALQTLGLGGYADAAEAQALSSLTKLLTPGRLNDAFKGGNQSLSVPGHQILPGGLILQWGQVSGNVDANSVLSTPFTYPITFPNDALIVFTTHLDGTPSQAEDERVSHSSKGQSSADITLVNNSDSNGRTVVATILVLGN